VVDFIRCESGMRIACNIDNFNLSKGNGMSNQVYKIVTDRIIEKLETGVVPWHKPWNIATINGVPIAPTNIVSMKPYRGINILLLSFTGHVSPFWLTFKQVNSLGGRINKGAKSEIVTFYKTYEKEITNNQGEKDTRKTFVLRYYRVFNIDDTTGVNPKKIPDLDTFDGVDPEASIQCAEDIIANMPKRPEIKIIATNKACYYPSFDRVEVPLKEQYIRLPEYYSTLFHELVHSTMHESRCNRKTGDHIFGTKDYSFEELVAEIGCAFLCGNCEIIDETLDNSAAYINSWVKKLKEDPKVIIKAASAAQKAADFIMGKTA
jgi:antirestriction protein ArdC